MSAGKNSPKSIPCGVASISRLLKIIRLFCKRALQKRQYSAKETYNFKEPTNRSHPILNLLVQFTTELTFERFKEQTDAEA